MIHRGNQGRIVSADHNRLRTKSLGGPFGGSSEERLTMLGQQQFFRQPGRGPAGGDEDGDRAGRSGEHEAGDASSKPGVSTRQGDPPAGDPEGAPAPPWHCYRTDPAHTPLPVRNLLAWNGFSLTLPDDWEVTAYHLDPDKGEFRCNRRLEPRLQLTWRRYPKAEPDVTRVLRDLHVRMCEQRLLGPEEPAMPERSGWTIARGRPQVPRHAARWDARNRLLVHVVLDPATTEAELFDLLDSWRSRSDGKRDHAIFGLRAVIPDSYHVEHLVPRPGVVRLITSGPGMHTLTVRRIGLARHFIAGRTLDAFFASLMRSDQAQVISAETCIVRGLPGAKVIYRKAGEHRMERVLGAFWKGTGWMWHDVANNRLCTLEQIGPKRTPHLEIDDVVPQEAG